MDDLILTIDITLAARTATGSAEYAAISTALRDIADAIALAVRLQADAPEECLGVSIATTAGGLTAYRVTGELVCGPFATREHAEAYKDMMQREHRQIVESLATLAGDCIELADISVAWDVESAAAVEKLDQDADAILEKRH